MNDVAIRAEGLGKSYRIGRRAPGGYVALRDVATEAARNLARSARDMFAGRPLVEGDEVEDFWALRGIDFEIRRGDVVGVVGRNGAGKSTLLKILSRITEPTEGRVEIRGRVASLLEVGTGFHPELTGRENIYLNGAILGMTRKEIRRRFDEIVAFAEVERFLDTPVKRFSSGMAMRLAFAVAAYLQPEILIVDEVLAVGDAEFQKKCLGKMEETASSGRTVLFVSHQLATVSLLCNRALLLQGGRLIAQGPPAAVIHDYIGAAAAASRRAPRADPAAAVALTSCEFAQGFGAVFNADEPIRVRLEVEVRRAVEPFRVGLRVDAPEIGTVLTSADADRIDLGRREAGRWTFDCEIPGHLLAPGDYTLSAFADVPMRRTLFSEDDVLGFTVAPLGAAGSRVPDHRRGVVRPLLRWRASLSETAEALAP